MEIQIVIQCPGRFTEVLPEEPESAELVIENCVSQALLELFETVVVDNVKISYSPSGLSQYIQPFGA
jgi:hypothetical protein